MAALTEKVNNEYDTYLPSEQLALETYKLEEKATKRMIGFGLKSMINPFAWGYIAVSSIGENVNPLKALFGMVSYPFTASARLVACSQKKKIKIGRKIMGDIFNQYFSMLAPRLAAEYKEASVSIIKDNQPEKVTEGTLAYLLDGMIEDDVEMKKFTQELFSDYQRWTSSLGRAAKTRWGELNVSGDNLVLTVNPKILETYGKMVDNEARTIRVERNVIPN